jgi:hypothetical protein
MRKVTHMAKKKVVKKVVKRKRKPVLNTIYDKVDNFIEEHIVSIPPAKRVEYRAKVWALFIEALNAAAKGAASGAAESFKGKVSL